MGGEVLPFDQASERKARGERARLGAKAKEERCLDRPARSRRRSPRCDVVVGGIGAGQASLKALLSKENCLPELQS